MRKIIEPMPGKQNQQSHPVGKSYAHDSAELHVSGKARYIDDVPVYPNQLYVATGKSTQAHATIKAMDLAAVKNAEGVVDVIVQADIPGEVDISPVFHGDLLLAGDTVTYVGQPLFAVAATSYEAALRATLLATIDYEPIEAVLDIKKSLADEHFHLAPHQINMGDVDSQLAQAPHVLQSSVHILGQEHFYLEGQVGAAIPNEDGGVHIYSSTQHPSESQKTAAEVLHIPLNKVTAEVRRMGGGFGGKESQACPYSCMAAIFAIRNQRPVRYRLPRKDDMVQTGKRHPFWNQYKVGFDDEGRIQGVTMQLAGDCGSTIDLSQGIIDRAMFLCDNAYFLKSAQVTGYYCKTHTVSNTAFRGFGGPQGMVTTESMIDDIARHLGQDPLSIRKLNLYKPGAQTTHYGQEITDHVLPDLVAQLETSSDYWQRREAIKSFNESSPIIRKGLALTPVKYGISFTATHLNQAGALVHIYTDGSVHLNHGGTEMGQGLYTKIAQIVARALGVDLKRVAVSATRTDKVPNTSPTAASSGSDLNGMAALNACETIKARLVEFATEHFQCDPQDISFDNDQVTINDQTMGFSEFIQLAYMNRVSLSATGFYKTPKIWYDRERGTGHPFFYFANGAACSEVVVNSLTGEYKVSRVDILHDVGDSLNPALDIGQIEGAFVQGMGWLTTEELRWDEQGRVMSNSPANYKIPTAFDLPEDLRVALFDRPNGEQTIYRSKAVGEPPLMLGISVWSALRDACASFADYRFNPRLDPPATPERVYWAIQEAQAYDRQQAAQAGGEA